MQTAEYVFRQLHNQPEASPLHRRLVELWEAVAQRTDGRVRTTVHAENAKLRGSDPAALRLLMSGELEFFTLLGGLLAPVIQLADFQSVPFAFRSSEDALRTSDGPLGDLLRRELQANGLYGLAPLMTFDNGMRQIGSRHRPIRSPDDLAGLAIRVPDGTAFLDTFRALGANPIAINVDGIMPALEDGTVDAQENALAVMALFRLDRAQRFVAMTNHMWSGFNLLANLECWRRLPPDISVAIEGEAARIIRLQRQEQAAFNADVRATFEARGVVFNEIDPVPFRGRLGAIYAAWQDKLGSAAWQLLESEVGALR